MLTFLLGEGRERERRLIFGALCRDVAGAGLIEGVRAEGRLAAVAVWLPPDAHPVPLRREARMVPSWIRLATMHARAIPRLRRAHDAGCIVHLDTGVPENVVWYRRFGFEVADEVRLVPGAPPTWGMRTGASRT